jgi:hypothetical protein
MHFKEFCRMSGITGSLNLPQIIIYRNSLAAAAIKILAFLNHGRYNIAKLNSLI